MSDGAGVVGYDAMTARRALDVSADRMAQALHEAQYARIRAGVMDAAAAYAEGLVSWERAHDAGERARLAADPRSLVHGPGRPGAGSAPRRGRRPELFVPRGHRELATSQSQEHTMRPQITKRVRRTIHAPLDLRTPSGRCLPY